MTAGTVIMNHGAGATVDQNVAVATGVGRRGMAGRTRRRVDYRGGMHTLMTGSVVMTVRGAAIIKGRGISIDGIMMDERLAVGSGVMTVQTVANPADHQQRGAIGAGYPGIVAAGRVKMTKGTVTIMNFINDRIEFNLGGRMTIVTCGIT